MGFYDMYKSAKEREEAAKAAEEEEKRRKAKQAKLAKELKELQEKEAAREAAKAAKEAAKLAKAAKLAARHDHQNPEVVLDQPKDNLWKRAVGGKGRPSHGHDDGIEDHHRHRRQSHAHHDDHHHRRPTLVHEDGNEDHHRHRRQSKAPGHDEDDEDHHHHRGKSNAGEDDDSDGTESDESYTSGSSCPSCSSYSSYTSESPPPFTKLYRRQMYETDNVGPDLKINPTTGKPFIRTQTKLGTRLNPIRTFVHQLQGLPWLYSDAKVDNAELQEMTPSLRIKHKLRKLGIPKEFQVLVFTEHLFIRPCYELTPYLVEHTGRYEILDSYGQRVYFAVEVTEFWDWGGYSNWQRFRIALLNFRGKKLLRMDGEPGYCGGAAEVNITFQNQSYGRVIQQMKFWVPTYDVYDEKNELKYTVHGPRGAACWGRHICWGGDFDFPIFNPDGTPFGKFTKHWTAEVPAVYNPPNSFGVQVPMELDVKLKVLLLSAGFLIYFQYFEQGGGIPSHNAFYNNKPRGYFRHGRVPSFIKVLYPILVLFLLIYGVTKYFLHEIGRETLQNVKGGLV